MWNKYVSCGEAFDKFVSAGETDPRGVPILTLHQPFDVALPRNQSTRLKHIPCNAWSGTVFLGVHAFYKKRVVPVAELFARKGFKTAVQPKHTKRVNSGSTNRCDWDEAMELS